MRLLPAQFPSELLVEFQEMFPLLSSSSAITEKRPTINQPQQYGIEKWNFPQHIHFSTNYDSYGTKNADVLRILQSKS